MIKLTENEAKALETCLNYGTRGEQLDDNFSNGGMPEFMDALGWNEKQAAALISSLEQKGLGWSEGKGKQHIFWLTGAGVNAIFDYLGK